MQQQQSMPSEPTADRTVDAVDIRMHCEQLCLRNYDENRRCRLTLSLSRSAPRSGYEATYELEPGDVVTELEIVPPGRYEVCVEGAFYPIEGEAGYGDDATEDVERASCNVGDRPPQTLLVECGNGVVSVSEGLA
jgi:hypothetical protein